ncbi:MAG: helicase, partial [Planctomycetes bacterium]|nr:helicase [Planctomycetota bacterium]
MLIATAVNRTSGYTGKCMESVLPSAEQIRDELHVLMRRELLGPFDGPNETIEEPPTIRYLVGMLAPQNEEIGEQQNDDFTIAGNVDDQDGRTELNQVRSDSLFPSSCGMTFTVEESVAAVKVTCTWGCYQRVSKEETGDGVSISGATLSWIRNHVCETIPSLDIRPGPIKKQILNQAHPDVYIQGISRIRNGQRVVSLFLVNSQTAPERNKDEAWLFQVGLKVAATDGAPIFRKRLIKRHRKKMDLDQFFEEEEIAMLYRHDVEFAVGHGVAVHATTPDSDPWHAVT